ncbi:hypothetical protein BFJ71_g1400 [Fusarium oxysporum]|nr:hypothetical protein BFJ71_g1400 [Fusarium oxysporum]
MRSPHSLSLTTRVVNLRLEQICMMSRRELVSVRAHGATLPSTAGSAATSKDVCSSGHCCTVT